MDPTTASASGEMHSEKFSQKVILSSTSTGDLIIVSGPAAGLVPVPAFPFRPKLINIS